MANGKGIVIDVGFKPVVAGFADKIQAEFDKIKFDDLIGLSDAFDRQKEKVEKDLVELRNEIDSSLNPNMGADAAKSFKKLENSVNALGTAFKAMQDAMPSSMAKRYEKNFSEMSGSVLEMTNMLGGATKVASDFAKVSEKASTSFNASKVKGEYKELLEILQNIELARGGKGIGNGGKQKFSADQIDVLVDRIKNTYIEAESAQAAYQKATYKNDEALITSSAAVYAQSLSNLQRYVEEYTKLSNTIKGKNLDTHIDIGGQDFAIKGLTQDLTDGVEETFDEVQSRISDRMAELNIQYSQNTGKLLSNTIKNKIEKEEKIKIPIGIETTGTNLYSEALKVIGEAQDKLASSPLEIGVQILSTSQTKEFKDALKEVKASLENINDEETRNRINELINSSHTTLDNALTFDVEVNTKKAELMIKEFSQQVQGDLKQISQALIITPKATIDKESKAGLSTEIKNLDLPPIKLSFALEGVQNLKDSKKLKDFTERIGNLKTNAISVSDSFARIAESVNKIITSYNAAGSTKKVSIGAETFKNLDDELANIKDNLSTIKDDFKTLADDIDLSDLSSAIKAIDTYTANIKSSLTVFGKKVQDSASEEGNFQVDVELSPTLSKDFKKKLQEQVSAIDIETPIDLMFDTKRMDQWTNEFLNSLTAIENKMQSMFGNGGGGLSETLDKWAESDKRMSGIRGSSHLRERSAVLGSSGKLYGEFDFDQHSSSGLGGRLAQELYTQGVESLIAAIHSHPEKFASMSLASFSGGSLSGDLISSYQKLMQMGIRYAIVNATEEIQVFDAEGFFKSNSNVDWSDRGTWRMISRATDEQMDEIRSTAHKLLVEDTVRFLGEDTHRVRELLRQTLSDLSKATNDQDISSLAKEMRKSLDPKEFYSALVGNMSDSKNPVQALFRTLEGFINDEMENASFSSFSKRKASEALKQVMQDGTYRIIKSMGYDVHEVVKALAQKTYGQEIPQIMSKALKGTGYKNDISDYLKNYTHEEFKQQNPLGLSSSALDSIFDTTAPNNFLESLNLISKKLQDIVTLVNSTDFSNAFTVKIDDESIGKLTRIKTIVTETGKEVSKTSSKSLDLSPIEKLHPLYEAYKKFYNNNTLDTEAGSRAALAYFTAYKEALEAKVNKKDLRKNTIDGKVGKLFTGKYIDYKKGAGTLDLSGLNSELAKYGAAVAQFDGDGIPENIKQLALAIEQVVAAGAGGEQTTAFLKSLNSLISKLGSDKAPEKIEAIRQNLITLNSAFKEVDIKDNGFVERLNKILEKGKELDSLANILKATDAANLKKAAEMIERDSKAIEFVTESTIANASGSGTNILYQNMRATKEGLVEVIALVKEATGEYKKYTVAVDENGDAQVRSTIDGNDTKLAKEVRAIESLQARMQAVRKNLGTGTTVFEFGSDEWDAIVQKASEFGIKEEEIRGITRNIDADLQESFQIMTEMGRITIGMDSDQILFQRNELENVDELVKKTTNDIQSFGSAMKTAFKGSSLNIDKMTNALDSVIEDFAQLQNRKDIGQIFDSDKISQSTEALKTAIGELSIDKIQATLSNGKIRTPEVIEQLDELKDKYKEIAKIDFNNLTSNDVQLLTEYTQKARELFSSLSMKNTQLADSGAIDKVLKKLYKDLNDNSAVSSELRHQFLALIQTMEAMEGAIPLDTFKQLTNEQIRLSTELERAGNKGKSFFDMIKSDIVQKSASVIAQYFSLYDIIRYAREMTSTVQSYDTALTEMRKVSDESVDVLKAYQQESYGVADSIGSTALALQNATADWLRLGESLEEAKESAKDATILLKVSEFESIDEATESLVAMSQAYQELGKTDIIDVLNNLGNNFSISTDGLAQALQVSASALKTAQNDFNEAVALVVAGNAVVQDPAKTGAGLRTIALRLTGKICMPEHIVIYGNILHNRMF